MARLYQFDYQTAPWCPFRYIIKCNDTSFYQFRRSIFRKYRQFEDMNNNILYYIGGTKIKSTDNGTILANIEIKERKIETKIGNFTVANLDICKRSYILKMNDKIIATITTKGRWTRPRCIIELEDINEQDQSFIFALIMLIDTAIIKVLNSILYPYSMNVSF